MTRVAIVVAALQLVSCGDDCEIEDALLQAMPLCDGPVRFDEEVAETRTAGGIAVVATRTTFPVPFEPALWPDESGLFLAHARLTARYTLVDSLGEDASSDLNVIAWNGQRYAAEADGSPVCSSVDPVRVRCDLETSLHNAVADAEVLILSPEADNWFLIRRARITEDEVVVGPEVTIPLDTLRR